MKKININKLKFSTTFNDYKYYFESNNNQMIFKRLKNYNKYKVIDKVTVNNDIISIENIYIKDNRHTIFNMTNKEKDIIVNDIFKVLKNNIINECVDLDEPLLKIKNSYINNIISNDKIGLSLNNNQINIILLSTYSIIGEIKIGYDVRVKVDELYLKESLDLLSKYMLVSKEDKHIYKKVK